MDPLNWRKMIIRILSVLMAILLWVYVTNEQGPVKEQIVSVPLKTIGLSDSYSVGVVPANVTVRYQSSRGKLAGFTEGDFKASVDLSGVTEGEQNVPVNVTPPGGVQITQISPARVNIYVDRVAERQIPVVAALKGTAAAGYVAMEPIVQPSSVTARGPKKVLESLNQFVVTVDISYATGLVENSLPLSSGSDKIEVNPKAVKVTVPVTQLPSKTVAVKPKLNGSPAEGYEVIGVTTRPETVIVTASSNILDGIDSLEAGPVDISGSAQGLEREARLVAPTGVNVIAPGAVTVVVSINPIKIQPGTPDNVKPPGQNQP